MFLTVQTRTDSHPFAVGTQSVLRFIQERRVCLSETTSVLYQPLTVPTPVRSSHSQCPICPTSFQSRTSLEACFSEFQPSHCSRREQVAVSHVVLNCLYISPSNIVNFNHLTANWCGKQLRKLYCYKSYWNDRILCYVYTADQYHFTQQILYQSVRH